MLDILSAKHDHRWIWTLWTCGIGAVDTEDPIFNT